MLALLFYLAVPFLFAVLVAFISLLPRTKEIEMRVWKKNQERLNELSRFDPLREHAYPYGTAWGSCTRCKTTWDEMPFKRCLTKAR